MQLDGRSRKPKSVESFYATGWSLRAAEVGRVVGCSWMVVASAEIGRVVECSWMIVAGS